MNPAFDISQEVIKNHESLSRCSRLFMEFVARNPDSLRIDQYAMLDLNDKLFQLQPWPTFINRETRREMAAASTRVFSLIKSVPSRLFGNDYEAISRCYEIPVNLVRYFLDGVSEPDIDNLVGRGDFILCQDGLKCLEYNISTNLGGLQLPLWESLYLNTPTISDFLARNNIGIFNQNLFAVYFEHLFQAARQRLPDSQGEMNIVIAVPYYAQEQVLAAEARYYNSVYRKVLADHGSLKGEVFLCGYPQLEVAEARVYYKGRRINTLVEWYQGFVPSPIRDVFKAGNILIYNGAVAWLLSAKSNLVLLSESADSELFTGEEKRWIKQYIPWTRRVVCGPTTYQSEKIQLEKFLMANRENLILKPSMGYGGKDIYIGRHTSESAWKDLTTIALKPENWFHLPVGRDITEEQWTGIVKSAQMVKNWVVQEYVESIPYLYQWGENGCAEHRAVWGYFIFGNCYAGSWLRVLPKIHDRGIINCHQGARVSVVFEVDQ